MYNEVKEVTRAERYKQAILKNKKRYTIREIAKAMGVCETYMYLVFNGQEDMTMEMDKKLSDYLNVHPIRFVLETAIDSPQEK